MDSPISVFLVLCVLLVTFVEGSFECVKICQTIFSKYADPNLDENVTYINVTM